MQSSFMLRTQMTCTVINESDRLSRIHVCCLDGLRCDDGILVRVVSCVNGVSWHDG